MAGTIKHEWNGTILTITSDSGTSSADLKGEKGDDGARGPQGKACSVATDTTHLGGVAAAEYALKTDLPQMTAYNLLDNSYFPAAFVINQRGQATYTGTAGAYAFDRWQASTAGVVLTKYENGVNIDNRNGTANGHIQQRLENVKDGVYTLFAYTHEGILMRQFSLSQGSIQSITVKNNTNSFTGVGYSNNILTVQIGAYKGAVITLYWAALYKGEYTAETMPKYQYKGYAAEWNECRRYYKRISFRWSILGIAIPRTTTTTRTSIVLPDKMRIKEPTATYKGTAVSLISTEGNKTINTLTPTVLDDILSITATVDSLTVGMPYAIYGGSDEEYIEISADL